MEKVFTASTEEDVINAAIELGQNTDPFRRAASRALKNISVPLVKHLQSELELWSSADDVANTLDATAQVLGSAVASLAMSAARGKVGTAKNLTDTLLELITTSAKAHIGQFDKMSTNGVIDKAKFNANK